MTKQFTTEDLIRYAYGEMTAHEKQDLEQSLRTDSRLQQEYEALTATMHQLGDALPGPSNTSMEIIMKFAKAQHPELQ